MTFYIGNSMDKLNHQDESVEFSDDLLDFIYKIGQHTTYDMRKLYEIDPYGDVKISKNDLQEIVDICNYVLGASLLRNYEDPTEGTQMLLGLAEIASKAMSLGLGLLSIGD